MIRLGLALLFASGAACAAAPAWVARSDAYTRPVLKDTGKYVPEESTELGDESYDTQVADLKPRVWERELADTEKRLAELRRQRAQEKDAKVRQDLDILIDSREKKIATMKLEHQYLLEYVNVGEVVYGGLRALLDPRNKPERQKLALVRLKRYAGKEADYSPIAVLARARGEERLADKALIGPYVGEVEEGLNNNATYMDGIAELFKKANIAGWESDFAALKAQVKDYDDWVKARLMPRTRKEVRLPEVIYVNRLANVGVDIAPEQMIERAGFDFQEVRDEMQVVAGVIAARNHLPSSDYRDVIRELKKSSIAPDQLMPYYRERLKDIEGMVRAHDLVTLPARGEHPHRDAGRSGPLAGAVHEPAAHDRQHGRIRRVRDPAGEPEREVEREDERLRLRRDGLDPDGARGASGPRAAVRVDGGAGHVGGARPLCLQQHERRRLGIVFGSDDPAVHAAGRPARLAAGPFAAHGARPARPADQPGPHDARAGQGLPDA